MLADLFDANEIFIYGKQLVWLDKKELEIITEHNNRQRAGDTKFILETSPEPWRDAL